MFYLLLASAAFASSDDALLRHDDLLGRFRAEWARSEVAAAAQARGERVPGGCFTTLMLELERDWDLFSPAERAEITGALAPWKADLFEEAAAAAPPPASGGATDSCFGQQRTNRLTGSNFVVEWNNGTTTEENAQDFLDALEEAYEIEVNQLGWRPPTTDGVYLLPAFIQPGNYASAYTTVDRCGSYYAPYIVAYAGSFYGGDWYATMALHEFNHALQFGYGYAPEFYWWEATATYIEEQVRPNSNWWSTYVVGYSQNPQLQMSAFSQSDQDVFYHMYGMSIWGFYLDQYQGGPDVVRQTWEAAAGHNGQYELDMETMAGDVGVDWLSAYTDFTARNAAMDYAEHRYFTAVDEVDDVRELPAKGQIGSRNAPAGYGQNYVRFDARAAGDAGESLVVHFSGDAGVDWLVQLVEVTDNAVVRTSVGTIVDGLGDVEMTTFGENDVMLVASPLQNRDVEREWMWDAELVAPPPEDTGTPGDDTGVTTDDTGGLVDDGGGKEKPGGCACASGAPETASLLGLVGLAALVGRRRRG